MQSVQEAKALFKRHNYEAAERLWKSVRGNLDRHVKQYHFLVNEWQEAIKYYGSSSCYHPWDALDYEEAVKRKTYEVNKKVYDWGYSKQHVNGTIDVIDILAKVKNKHTLFGTEQHVIHYAVDRYQNGMRRKQNRKFEDAIVRFAQVIEILCNYRIYRLAQGDYLIQIGSKKSVCTPPDYSWEFKPLIQMLFGTGSVKVKSEDCYVSQDKRMNWKDYGCDSVKDITDAIQPRNDFLHFNNPMRKEKAKQDAENLRQLALEFLTKFSKGYCCKNDLDFNDLLELHKFRR